MRNMSDLTTTKTTVEVSLQQHPDTDKSTTANEEPIQSEMSSSSNASTSSEKPNDTSVSSPTDKDDNVDDHVALGQVEGEGGGTAPTASSVGTDDLAKSSSQEELYSRDEYHSPTKNSTGHIKSRSLSKNSPGINLVELPSPKPKFDPLRRSTTTMSSVDSEMLEKQVMIANQEDDCDGFISQIDKDGNIKQVPVKYDDDKAILPVNSEEDAGTSINDFLGADILAKPFNFVSGNVTKKRFNPFRKKKSGLLNVLAKQATRNRLVAKNGAVNTQSQSEGKAHKFFKDVFITLLDSSWSLICALFATAFFSSWLSFAALWYLTLLQHGDFDEANQRNSSFKPCVTAINDFTSCFLFSVETQHTIGYGTRATTEECPLAIIVMCFQSIVGVIIQACMAGIIFAKFTVPRKRGETIIFSKNAVVTMRNGSLFILCRVSDLRKYSLLEAHVRMIVIRKEKTEEGEVIPYQQTDLECGSEVSGGNDRVLVFWPVTIGHKIDEDSPFYEMTPRDFLSHQFEIVVTLEGVTEETGNTVQARTSYLPNEILWGHHFENAAVAYDKKAGMYSVQHSIINKTVVDLTPRCSARQLVQRRDCKRTSSAMTNTSSSEEVSPRTTFRVEQNQ